MRKYLPPVIAALLTGGLLVGYFIGIIAGFYEFGLYWPLLLFAPIFLWLLWTLGAMLIERFHEIKEEDKDDLSQY